MAVCVSGGTGCPGQWQHLLGKFPFYAIEQWGKLETGCSAEPHICLARRYRLSSANRRFSTLGAPGEAGARGQAPGLLDQGKAKATPPRPAHPAPDSARGEIRGWQVPSSAQGPAGRKRGFSACTDKLRQDQRPARARPQWIWCSATAHHPLTKGSRETPASRESPERHRGRERLGQRRPSLTLRAAGPVHPALDTRGVSAAEPGRANPAQRQRRAVPCARKTRHR